MFLHFDLIFKIFSPNIPNLPFEFDCTCIFHWISFSLKFITFLFDVQCMSVDMVHTYPNIQCLIICLIV